MRVNHKFIVSDVFEVFGTYEFDVEFGPEKSFELRVEMMKSTTGRYRARLWFTDAFRLSPSEGPAGPFDITLFVDWSSNIQKDLLDFEAESDQAAVAMVAELIEKAL